MSHKKVSPSVAEDQSEKLIEKPMTGVRRILAVGAEYVKNASTEFANVINSVPGGKFTGLSAKAYILQAGAGFVEAKASTYDDKTQDEKEKLRTGRGKTTFIAAESFGMHFLHHHPIGTLVHTALTYVSSDGHLIHGISEKLGKVFEKDTYKNLFKRDREAKNQSTPEAKHMVQAMNELSDEPAEQKKSFGDRLKSIGTAVVEYPGKMMDKLGDSMHNFVGAVLAPELDIHKQEEAYYDSQLPKEEAEYLQALRNSSPGSAKPVKHKP